MGGHLSCMYVDMSSIDTEPIQSNSSGVLKVVLACEGRTCEFSEPVKVAELMLEFPNHFVAEYDVHTNNGGMHAAPPHMRRVSPLPADHDAKLSHIYLLLPMHRLNTRLSADELNLISTLATMPTPSGSRSPLCMPPSLAKAGHTWSKITPLSACHYQEAASQTATTSNASIVKSYSVPILELFRTVGSMEDFEETEQAESNATQQLHILRSKSWTPKLETIIESYSFSASNTQWAP